MQVDSVKYPSIGKGFKERCLRFVRLSQRCAKNSLNQKNCPNPKLVQPKTVPIWLPQSKIISIKNWPDPKLFQSYGPKTGRPNLKLIWNCPNLKHFQSKADTIQNCSKPKLSPSKIDPTHNCTNQTNPIQNCPKYWSGSKLSQSNWPKTDCPNLKLF